MLSASKGVSYSLYYCETAVIRVHDLLPIPLIQAVTFHTHTTSIVKDQ